MIADFNITSPEVARNPYALFTEMRRASPVCRLQPIQLLSVGRYHDVVRVLHDSKRFSNSGYNASVPKEMQENSTMPPSIVQVDPPRHGQLRALVTKAFTPRTVAQLEPRIRELSRELIDGLRGQSTFELTSAITIPLPMIVIAELLGVGPERRGDFKRWSDDFVSTLALVEPGNRERVRRSTEEFYGYFGQVLEERRKEPRDDLISRLLLADVDGSRLTPEEVLSFANTLLIGGNETTTSLIGNAMVALTDNPDQLAEVQENPALIPALIEEVLRFESPAQCIFRQTTTDVDLDGVTIPRGAVVLPLLASANHDESRFPDPDRFDIHRDTKGQIAFGIDIHFCIGAALARLEARVLLEEMLGRMKNIQRAEKDVAWTPSFFIRSPQSLPLRARID
ncbi:cytochrome P450 [Chondromyces crocatus]|uniref:Cytochrome P450 n=1 Tax=Chondromyces crocatus TaxID=52 RepID=A0A0K1EDF4_CHOCO|nr:cytochrome P450 [Chondromyces crocatus]AKT38588.1 cytochrome P450 [Chondromyces crocatus]